MSKFKLLASCVGALSLILCAGTVDVLAQQRIATGGQTEIVLVANGKSLAPIILPTDPTMFTKIAAVDLAEYIGKVSGVKPEILEGLPNPIPEHAIWVGFQPKLKEIFPGTDFDFKNSEELLIKSNGKNLAIVGRDVWDPNAMKIKGGKTDEERRSYLAGFQFGNRDVEGYQLEYGTVNAVYTFLQDYLGVRWLWADKEGEVVPKQVRVAFKPFEFRYYPKIRQRSSIFVKTAIYKSGGAPGDAQGDWARRQRVQLDSIYVPASGHGFGDWYERFFKTHPEYFAMQSDGKRGSSDPEKPRNAKICESNPSVWDQWIKDVEQIVAKNPHKTVFSAAANDGYGTGICCCEECRKWDSPEAEKRLWNYPGGKPIVGVALSDRQVKFANILASQLKQRFPDKNYRVLIHAYGYSRPAPLREIPSENVIISNVANLFFSFEGVDVSSPLKTKAIDEFNAWCAVSKNQLWRPNTGDIANWKTGGPPAISSMGDTFKKIAEKGVLGISIDQVWGWWATQGPQYYLMAQIAWNPDKNADEIMEDYYKSGFGPAADEIKAYWSMLDKAQRDIANDKKQWADVFTPDLFKVAYAILGKADKKANGQNGYAERIAYVQAGLDYLRLNTENQALARKIIDSKDPLPEATEKMRSNWEEIVKICERHPEALLSSSIKTNPSNGYLAYIHPDADHKKLDAARIKKENYKKRRAAAQADAGLE